MANARRGRSPPGMVFCTVDLPDGVHVDTLDELILPPTWYKAPASPELQALGDAWVQRGESVALLVPSAITRIESNAILNPNHVDFAQLTIGASRDIPLDEPLREPQRRRGRP